MPPRKFTPPEEVVEALDYALRNIRDFSKLHKPRNWSRTNREGATVGEKFDPLERVGIYVPGGTAPLVSTALMTVALAKEARRARDRRDHAGAGQRHAALRAASRRARRRFTRWAARRPSPRWPTAPTRIARVQKIFGPGNAWVVEAKRQVVGAVAIDQLPGPSEIAVVADETAKAAFVASDLLAQAEHGSGSQVLFLTPSAKLLADVEARARQAVAGAFARTSTSPRRWNAAARSCWSRTWARRSAWSRISRRNT